MKKAIVTTTINPPTKALLKFIEICQKDDWKLFIVGDQKTPHDEYKALEDKHHFVRYIGPEHQEAINKKLSDLIGWNCIQRRNFGFIVAYQQGADVIATVDDDNIPNDNWGQNLAIGNDVQQFDLYAYKDDVGPEYTIFDPLAPTSHGPNFWHRGFPIQLLPKKNRLKDPVQATRKVLVQADLWDGAPDIDAICRINKPGDIYFKSVRSFYGGDKAGPFNSQNTFLSREVIPDYFMYPHIGRMDDIFAGYYVQAKYPGSVVYGPPSVFQARNEHDLVKDLEAELIGYKYALTLADAIMDNRITQDATRDAIMETFIGEKSAAAFKEYRKCLKS